jgi:hypothetical protein
MAASSSHESSGLAVSHPVDVLRVDPAAPADGAWTFSPVVTPSAEDSVRSAGLRLGAATRAGVAITVAEQAKNAEAATRRQLLPKYGPKDLELGLVPGGELVTLARDFVRTSVAPISSHATLEFTIDGAGTVTSARVLDVSSGRSAWDEVATMMVPSVHGKTLRTRPEGVVVTVEITSALKTVDGATPTEGSGFGATVASVAGAITNPLGTIAGASVPRVRVVAAHIVDVRSL